MIVPLLLRTMMSTLGATCLSFATSVFFAPATSAWIILRISENRFHFMLQQWCDRLIFWGEWIWFIISGTLRILFHYDTILNTQGPKGAFKANWNYYIMIHFDITQFSCMKGLQLVHRATFPSLHTLLLCLTACFNVFVNVPMFNDFQWQCNREDVAAHWGRSLRCH